MGKKKTHEEFVEELNRRGIDVIPLEKYNGLQYKISFRCNKCNYEWKVTPGNLFRNGGCHRCHGRERYNLESFKEKLSQINNTIEVIGEYRNTTTKIRCRCLNCNSEWEAKPSKLLCGSSCPICNRQQLRLGKYKILREDFELLIEDKPIKLIGEYKGTSYSTNFQCSTCGHIWKTRPCHILEGTGCPHCLHESLKLSENEFLKRIATCLPNIQILSKFNGTNHYVQYKCTLCNKTHTALASNLLHGFGCPYCKISKGEKKCMDYFDVHSVQYVPQYEFDDLFGINNGKLKFDFAVFDKGILQFLVEYDGIFHYKKLFENDGHEKLLLHDKLKNEYCKNKQILLLRIPYWDYDNVDTILEKFIKNNSKNLEIGGIRTYDN